jgi:hypothetical protein
MTRLCMPLHAGYKAKNTQIKYIKLLFFHSSNSCTNGSQCYVILTLPVLFINQPECFVCDVLAKMEESVDDLNIGTEHYRL